MSDALIARVTRVGGDDDVSWDLLEGSSLVVGSDDACHINVPADATDVSGRHVMISCARGYVERRPALPARHPSKPHARARVCPRTHAPRTPISRSFSACPPTASQMHTRTHTTAIVAAMALAAATCKHLLQSHIQRYE